MSQANAAQLLNTLRSPARALQAFGEVHDQRTGRFIKYNPTAITHELQHAVLDYMSNTPRLPTGETVFLSLLGYRQAGKSLTTEYAAYCKAAFIPGWDHVCIADNRDRADYLHKRVHYLHQRWPESLRSKSMATRESRQLTFDPLQGGKMRVLSAESGAVGVGQSPDSFHACLGKGTMVLCGETGALRPIEEFRVGDLVRTHSGQTAPITYISSKEKMAWRVKLFGFAEPLTVTPEHKLWTNQGWLTLQEVAERKARVGFPILRPSGQVRELPFEQPVVERPQGGGSNEVGIPETVHLTYPLGKLVGLYLAEGSMHSERSVTFSVHWDEVSRTVDWLDEERFLFTNATFNFRANSQTATVYVSGRSFAHFLRNLVGEKDEKRFPDRWWEMPEEFVRGIVHGYLSGDGHSNKHKYNRRITLTSIRSATITGLRDALAGLGYGWGTIRRRKAGNHYGRNCQEAWILDLCGSGVDRLARDLGWESPPRTRRGVTKNWNLEEDGEHVWVAIQDVQPLPGLQEVYDFEVGHEDHSYCLAHIAVSNSEVHLWSDFSGSMFLINPSLINRREALVVFEATPWERNCAWHDHYVMAKQGSGRHIAKFFPFWDGKLNARPTPKDFQPTNEEVELLNRYQSLGLTTDNLTFRRFIMDTDPEVRRNPEMFGVMYPFDDLSCWIASANAAIPQHCLEKHLKKELQPWSGPYMEYEMPEAGAIYVIGVDPSGYAARDHASFQVLKCWKDEWTQVASFAEHIDPLSFTNQLLRAANRYNQATICVESNGVGQSVLALLQERDYRNVYYEARFKPGFTSTSKSLDQATGWLIDGLLDELVLNDRDLLEQLQTYKNDKRTEESPASEILRGASSNKRRDRHHWDKVSALLMAVVAARRAPVREKPGANLKGPDENVIMFTGMSYDEQEHYRKKLAEDKQPTRKKLSYRSVRKRRR